MDLDINNYEYNDILIYGYSDDMSKVWYMDMLM